MTLSLAPSPSRLKRRAVRIVTENEPAPETTIARVSFVDVTGQLASLDLTETEVWLLMCGLAWSTQGRPDRPSAGYWERTATERGLLARLSRIEEGR